MAVYKVPQDVEAEDKLLGPFTFRQFIYLIVVAVAGFMAWLLGQIFIGLALIPLPVIVVFGILALPLRKDQPMETYVAAVIRFYLKPKRRLWAPDGTLSLVEILAPKHIEEHHGKDISQNEAVDRLTYLAQIMDTRGWATRGVTSDDAAAAGIGTQVVDDPSDDILDPASPAVQSFDELIQQKDVQQREEALAVMHREPAKTNKPAQPEAPEATQAPAQTVTYNPYPRSMHQKVVQPMSAKAPGSKKTAPSSAPQSDATAGKESASDKQLPPDIIELANNPDLTVSTIAHEVHRLEKKHLDEGEVVISLR